MHYDLGEGFFALSFITKLIIVLEGTLRNTLVGLIPVDSLVGERRRQN